MIKLIQDFNDYCVSDDGKVFRIKNNELVELKTYICNGHNCIKLRGKKLYVASLVAELYLGKKPESHLIFHKNKNKLDDRVVNLIYLTPSEVQLYSTYTQEYLEHVVFK